MDSSGSFAAALGFQLFFVIQTLSVGALIALCAVVKLKVVVIGARAGPLKQHGEMRRGGCT